jgi:hypothetical protein
MLTVILGIYEFHVITLMIEQHSHSAQYFLNYILGSLLLAVFPDGRKPHSRWLSLHFDNCRLRRSEACENFFSGNSIIRVPRLPYSHDLAAFDFWVFGHMNTAPVRQQFPGSEDLLTVIQEFLSEIRRSQLEPVFHHWIEQVQQVLTSDGDDFHE